jgi:hypothetical protein
MRFAPHRCPPWLLDRTQHRRARKRSGDLSKPQRNGLRCERTRTRQGPHEQRGWRTARRPRRNDNHVAENRHRKRDDCAQQERDAHDQLAGVVHLVVCSVHDREGQHQCQQDQAQRAEQGMAQATVELPPKFDHARQNTASLLMALFCTTRTRSSRRGSASRGARNPRRLARANWLKAR